MDARCDDTGQIEFNYRIAIAAIRYCQHHRINLTEAMPDHFDEDEPVSPERMETAIAMLNDDLESV
jgi:hypothetical protein